MKKILCIVTLALAVIRINAVEVPSVKAMLERIGGEGASELILIDMVSTQDAAESFTITSRDGRPLIEGTSISSITTGINWYLNHYAHVNLSWNNLTTNLKMVNLPVPEHPERHECNADYRYYLNYCTFSYSMSTWSWERWQQEIDWMALHGINMPLQIVGMDVVWKHLLMHDYGYAETEAESFIAGPSFQAWWGMNNLEGWGGPNPRWWYDRETKLAKLILDRERELGMQPVLPGFSGTVPHNFQKKTGMACMTQGGWFGFTRPYIMDPNSPDFAKVAERYYDRLEEVMGKSRYYSMDPFHEGGRIASGQYKEGYHAIYEAMNRCCGDSSHWIIQQWGWQPFQATSLTAVPAGRLIVLDLFSDGQPAFKRFKGYAPQQSIYCAIPNYGGRTGFFGRLPRVAHDYFAFRKQYAGIHGIGAAPEAIEQTPIVYDLLFELAWMQKAPDTEKWIKEYTLSRYGQQDSHAERAWEFLLHSILNDTSKLQGPHEATMCARPSLTVKRVSRWGGTKIFYDSTMLIQAVRELMQARIPTSHPNFSYDLCDLTRQVMSDRSKTLLEDMRAAHEAHEKELFAVKRDSFLSLILDLDTLLGTNRYFRLGYYDRPLVADPTKETIQRMDTTLNNPSVDAEFMWSRGFRTLITTWGPKVACKRGLGDYSYRQWQGMLSDYYYPRWRYFFDHKMHVPERRWFQMEWDWAHDRSRCYSPEPKGNTLVEARKLMNKYIH